MGVGFTLQGTAFQALCSFQALLYFRHCISGTSQSGTAGRRMSGHAFASCTARQGYCQVHRQGTIVVLRAQRARRGPPAARRLDRSSSNGKWARGDGKDEDGARYCGECGRCARAPAWHGPAWCAVVGGCAHPHTDDQSGGCRRLEHSIVARGRSPKTAMYRLYACRICKGCRWLAVP